ncbi:MAG: hypothetical protein LH473_00020 [Chitinophagales bacterium]|nr:hypothetical protein [Chitinophagales bacterium]
MRKIILFILLLASFRLTAQQLAIGQWKDELTYHNAYSVTASDNKIYCGTVLSMYAIDLADNSYDKISKVDGLSDISISHVAFNKEKNLLLVIYSNSNIDIIRDGKITNISDIKRKNIVGDKAIYGTYFLGDYAYLSCGFGIVVLDVEKYEIKDTYYIGANGTQIQVNGITSDNSFLYAATATGIYRGELNDPFLADYSRWHLFTKSEGAAPGNFLDIVSYNGLPYCAKKDTIFQLNNGVWSQYYYRKGFDVKKLEASKDALVISQIGTSGARVNVLYASGKNDSIYTPQPYDAIEKDGVVWIADLYNGLQKFSNNYLETVFPDCPWTSNVFDLAVNKNTHNLYVATGGWNASYGFIFNSDGFFTRIDGEWDNYNYYNTPILRDSFDFVCATVNYKNNRTYFGTMWRGIVEFDDVLGITNQWDADNSSLSGVNGDILRVKAADIEFDRYNNMWVSNIGALVPVCVMKDDGTWLDFLPSFTLEQGWITNMTFDNYDQTWFVIPRQGLMVFNYGESLDNASDDRWKKLINVPGSGNLPSLEVNCVATDKDGTIWVGTGSGVAVFYCPGDVFSDFGCEAQQIIVNSGGYNGYLLATENVKRIVVDGANRKWIATDNGVWLFSADGTELLQQFTFDNSPRTSNFVNALDIDETTGEVYIGVENGIIIYKGDATPGSTSSCGPAVYPNPVREDYSGTIAISGVLDDADIKITDATGHLIYRTKALGGQAVWDGKNYNGERAATGVYLVWAANADATVTCITKLLIVN